MVSKTLVCLAVLALVAVCYGGPTGRTIQKNQKPCDSSSQSSSDESGQQPCDLIQKQEHQQQRYQNKKNIHVQDTSSSSESDERQRRVNIRLSQEQDNQSKELRYAPEHEMVQGSHNNPHYLQKQQKKHNEQRSRQEKNEISSNEDISEAKKNVLRKY